MERLTEKVLGFVQLKDCGNDFCKETCAEHDEEKSCDNCPIQKAFEKLAEYEDLEEQGKLLKLPCAVGDIVYRIIKEFHTGTKKIISGKVYRIALTNTEMQIFIDKWQSKGVFGKTVFLTRQEAEQALKEKEVAE